MNKLLLTLIGICFIYVTLFTGCPQSTPSNDSSYPQQQPPNAPINLVGQPISHNTIHLIWTDNANNEDGFRIYRDGISIGSVGPNSTSYQDTGLQPSRTYLYDVRAFNETGESGSSCSVKTLNPPLNVTLNYIGVMFDHDPLQGAGDIGLIVVITDGVNSIQEVIPPSGNFQLNDYEVMELNQRVFASTNASEYLKISIIAYDDDQEGLISDIVKAALPILGLIMGVPDVTGILGILDSYEQTTGKPLLENQDDRVGYFEGYWSANESWGIGQYDGVGAEDFRLWFTIWAEDQPQPIPQPSLQLAITAGWYVGGSEVTSINETDIVSARVALSGGNPGTYTIRVRRDVSFGSDQTVWEESFSYDGLSTTRELFFVPPYATGEYSTNGYHIDILKDGVIVWTMPNSYPPRLTVLKDIPAPLLITFNGWYVGGNPVTTASETDTVTARVTLSGGDSGTYTIRIRRDISLGADQTVQEESFSYDGLTTTQQISFKPPYATGESSTDGYHIDILKDGATVWTMPNSYPPRLMVTAKSGGPLSINFNGWYVNGSKVTTANKGSKVTAIISLLGGEAGNYTIQIRRDISFGADEIVKQVTFSYDGTSDIKQVSFIPQYATGESSTNGYHIDVLKDGTTIWSMTNSYPPRLRVVST